MSVPTEKAMVRREKLKEVVGDNKWRINNILDKENEPRSASIIVEEALRQVGKMMDYSVISKNCEHFANELRYGKHESQQVRKAGDTAMVVGGAAAAVVLGIGALAGVMTAESKKENKNKQ
ncbi:phospholipase A and acyltransferase 3-like [Acanthopagrus schlegelii]